MLKYILKICEKIGLLVKCLWNAILWTTDKCTLPYGFYNFIRSWVLIDTVKKKNHCVALLDNSRIWVSTSFAA